MAQIEILKDSSVLKTFLCKLSLEEVNNKTEEEITKIAQNAEIKGFRKGHAPLKMIKEMYFAKAYNMAADHLINSTITKIAEENNLKLIASPSVKLNEEVKEHVEFEVTFELLPSIPENFNFSEVSVKTFEVDLQEEEVTKELNEIAKRNKVFTKKDGVSENGDIVVIDTTGRIDGVEFAGGKLENHQLELGSGSFIPGFEEQLIGLKAEETKLVEVSFPSDYHAKDLAGKPAQFFTIIKEVKKGETPELNDELAKKLSLESLEALKTHVTNRIKDFY